MGRKHVLGALVAVIAITVSLWAGLGTANAQPKAAKLDTVTLQLKWVTQAQFAGYYAARAGRLTSASTGSRASSQRATPGRTS